MTQEPQRFRNTIIFPASLDPDAVRVVTRLQDQGFESYLVGGCVRDLLAGLIPKDFDVSTEARPRQIRRVFRNSRIIGRRFKLAHVHFGSNIIEVATFRRTPDEAEESSDDNPGNAPESEDEARAAEVTDASEETVSEETAPERDAARDDEDRDDRDNSRESRDGRRRRGRRRRRRGDDAPDTAERDGLLIVRDNEFGTAEEDVIRRDFTINALLYDVTKEEVIDYVGGVQDLTDRVMRTIGDAPIRLAEDPVRMLRAVKFTSRLDLHLDDELDAAMRSCAHLIERSAAPRVLEEIYKFLTCGNAERALDMLVEYDLLTYLLPEVAPYWNQNRDELRALGAAIDMLDGGRRKLSNGFLLAALFCPVWRGSLEDGSDPVAVARDVITPAAQRMSIPRKDVAEVKQLLATLLRLERNRRSRRVRIQEYLKRSATRDAIQLLHLLSRAGISDPELHARWAYRLAALDPQPPTVAKSAAAETSEKSDDEPRPKRRRRRGGRRSRSRRARPDEQGGEQGEARQGRQPQDKTGDTTTDKPEETDRERDRAETTRKKKPAARKVEQGVDEARANATSVDETPVNVPPNAEVTGEEAAATSDEPRGRSGIKGLVRRLIHRVRGGNEAAQDGAERHDGDAETTSADAADERGTSNNTAPSDEQASSAAKNAAAADASGEAVNDDDGTTDGDATSERPRAKRRRRGGRRRRSGSGGASDSASTEDGANKDGNSANTEKSRSKQGSPSSKRKRSTKKTSGRGAQRRGEGSGEARKPTKKRPPRSRSKPASSETEKKDDSFGQRHPEDVEDFFDW